MRLLGAFLPNTLEGTIVGNPLSAMDVTRVDFTEVDMNRRRETVEVSFFFIGVDINRSVFRNSQLKGRCKALPCCFSLLLREITIEYDQPVLQHIVLSGFQQPVLILRW